MKSVGHTSAEVPGISNFRASLSHLQIQPPTLRTLKCSKLRCTETSAGLSVNSDGRNSNNEQTKKERKDGQAQMREEKTKNTKKTHTQPQNMGQTSHRLAALSHLLNSRAVQSSYQLVLNFNTASSPTVILTGCKNSLCRNLGVIRLNQFAMAS